MPQPDGRWADVRMRLDELDAYEVAVDVARVAVPNLTLRIGLECEYLPELDGFYRDELLGRRRYDYLIGGGHYTELDGRWRGSFEHLRTPAALRQYAAMLERMMASGFFAFIAHPDLFGCCNPVWNADTAACAADICAASVATRTPLELNAYGIRKPWIDTPSGQRPGYPWSAFWDVAGTHGVRVVLSSDAHRPEDVLHGHEELIALRDQFGLLEADLGALAVPTCGNETPRR
jgi:histidinol-phosphatase (PHP family)